MTVQKMRELLLDVYGGPLWRMRLNEMSGKQIVAIYSEMERKGKLHGKNLSKKMEPGIKKATQLSIFDMPEFKDEGSQHDHSLL